MSTKIRLPKWLWMLPIIMFGFSFALVPIYNVFCTTTGLNGKPSLTAAKASTKVDTSRTVKVQFTTTLNETLPWRFEPKTHTVLIHPGEAIDTSYLAENLTAKPMTVQAIPSISPAAASKYVKKLECFCFQHQSLDGGNHKDLPLTFYLDSNLPASIETVTLSYTLFDITELAKE